jgi:hypothetical protein
MQRDTQNATTFSDECPQSTVKFTRRKCNDYT